MLTTWSRMAMLAPLETNDQDFVHDHRMSFACLGARGIVVCAECSSLVCRPHHWRLGGGVAHRGSSTLAR